MRSRKAVQPGSLAQNALTSVRHSLKKRRIHLIFGAFPKSAVFGSKRIGGWIIRHDATLSLNAALKRLPNLGGILLGHRASRKGDRQNTEKKSHTSHKSHNKKTDPQWQLSFRQRNY